MMVKILDCSLEVNEFELYLRYNIPFQINPLTRGIEPSYSVSSYGLNSITAVLLQGYIRHYITHEDWYSIKTRSQNEVNPLLLLLL